MTFPTPLTDGMLPPDPPAGTFLIREIRLAIFVLRRLVLTFAKRNGQRGAPAEYCGQHHGRSEYPPSGKAISRGTWVDAWARREGCSAGPDGSSNFMAQSSSLFAKFHEQFGWDYHHSQRYRCHYSRCSKPFCDGEHPPPVFTMSK